MPILLELIRDKSRLDVDNILRRLVRLQFASRISSNAIDLPLWYCWRSFCFVCQIHTSIITAGPSTDRL